MYRKTSNKSLQHLFVHLTNPSLAFNRDLALIGDPAFISITYKWQNTGTRQWATAFILAHLSNVH